jgi:hypothetical protein
MSSDPPTGIRPPATRELPAEVWLEVTHQLDSGRARPRHVRTIMAAAAAIVVVAVGIGGATMMRPHAIPGAPAGTMATTPSALPSASPTLSPTTGTTSTTPSAPALPTFTGSPEATETFQGWAIAYYRNDSQQGLTVSYNRATMIALVTFSGNLAEAKLATHEQLLVPAYTPPAYAPLTGAALLNACTGAIRDASGPWTVRVTSTDQQTIVVENAAHVAFGCDGYGGTLTVSKAGTAGKTSQFYLATMSGVFADGDHGERVVGFGKTSSSVAGVTYVFADGTSVPTVVGGSYWLLGSTVPNAAIVFDSSSITVNVTASDGRKSTSTFRATVDTVCQQINHGC